MHAPPRPSTSTPSGSGSGKSSGNARRGMNWGTLMTNAPASIAMWRIDAIHCRCRRRSGPARSAAHPRTRPTGQRHAVLPADEPTDAAHAGELDHVEVVARADAVEHALVHRGHELAVPVQHALGSDQQQRVVEGPGPLVLALVDADRDVHTVIGAGSSQPRDQRPRDVDARRPHALPQLVARVPPRRGRRRPRAGRVHRHEALGEHHERAPSRAAVATSAIALSTVASASSTTGVACTAATRTVSKGMVSDSNVATSMEVRRALRPVRRDWDDLHEGAQAAAEAAGLDGVWLWDHLAGSVHGASRVLECWTSLTAIAASVPRITVGPMVLNVANRDPGTLAVMARPSRR